MMRFIDDEYGREFLRTASDQKLSEFEQKFAFVLPRRAQAEIGDDVLQEFCRRQPAIEQIRIRNILTCPQEGKEAAKQKGLARANLACHHNESLMPAHAVVKGRQRLFMPPGRDETGRVRYEVERIARETEEGFVHKVTDG